MITFQRSYLLLFVLLVFSSAGCALYPGKYKEPKKLDDNVHVTSLRASAIVDFKDRDQKSKARILLKEPNLLRIELRGPFSKLLAAHVSDGEKFKFYSSETKKAVVYKNSDSNFPYSFEAGELVSFLTGSFVVGSGKLGSDYKVTYGADGRLSRFIRLNGDEPVYIVELGDYRSTSGAVVPFMVNVIDKKESFTIRYTNVEINPSVDNSAFTLPGSK